MLFVADAYMVMQVLASLSYLTQANKMLTKSSVEGMKVSSLWMSQALILIAGLYGLAFSNALIAMSMALSLVTCGYSIAVYYRVAERSTGLSSLGESAGGGAYTAASAASLRPAGCGASAALRGGAPVSASDRPAPRGSKEHQD